MPVINSIISMFSTKRLAQIDFFKENPIQVQRDTLVELLRRAADTEYGLKYDFDSILTAEQYRANLEIYFILCCMYRSCNGKYLSFDQVDDGS